MQFNETHLICTVCTLIFILFLTKSVIVVPTLDEIKLFTIR